MSPDYYEVTPCILSGLMQHHTSQPHGFIFWYMRTVPFQIPLLLGHAFVSLFSCLFSHKHGSRQDGAVDLTVREGGGSGVGVQAPSRKPRLLHHLQIACESIILYNPQSLILLNLAPRVSLPSYRRRSRGSVCCGWSGLCLHCLINCM